LQSLALAGITKERIFRRASKMKDLFGFELRQQRVTCNACGAAFMRRRTNHRYCCDKCRIRKFYQHVRAEEKVIDAKIDELMRREARL
jgi:ribosomal protein L37AE/L43A